MLENKYFELLQEVKAVLDDRERTIEKYEQTLRDWEALLEKRTALIEKICDALIAVQSKE